METTIMNLTEIDKLISQKTAEFISRHSHKMLIDGRWVAGSSGATFNVVNPASEEIIAQVPFGDAHDIDRAVKAAQRAFESAAWSKMRSAERQRLLLRLADLVE